MAEIIETQISLGYTDGYRFIGIQPPLSDTETKTLLDEGLVASTGHIETHLGEHACSLLRYGTGSILGEIANGQTIEKARIISAILAETRGVLPEIDTRILALTGPASSPFNRNTDR